MSLPREELIEVVREALLVCSKEFETTANAPSIRMPESWIQVSVMQAAARRGLVAYPELSARHDFECCETDGVPWRPLSDLEKLGARIDLVLGEASANTERMRVQAAIELKGPKSSWGNFPGDLLRLQALAPLFRSQNQARFFGYVSWPMTEEGKSCEIVKFEQFTKLNSSQYQVTRGFGPSMWGEGDCFPYVFLHVL